MAQVSPQTFRLKHLYTRLPTFALKGKKPFLQLYLNCGYKKIRRIVIVDYLRS